MRCGIGRTSGEVFQSIGKRKRIVRIVGDFIGDSYPSRLVNWDEGVVYEEAKEITRGTLWRQWKCVEGKTMVREKVIEDDAWADWSDWREISSHSERRER